MEQESVKRPVVYLYNIRYADNAEAGAKLFENLINEGITDLQVTKCGRSLYRFEYKVPRKDD